jgi:long-chain fatty acid transport protein
VSEAEAFAVQRYSAMLGLGERTACMASYREPWAEHANYGTTWAGAGAATEQHFSSADFGLTCRVMMPLSTGRIHFIGGVSYQQAEYELVQSAGLAGFRTTSVSDDGFAWRLGLAYDIPDYALRVSVIYNSAIAYRMTGAVSIPGLFSTPVFGNLDLPQSIEMKLQSGIAPGWLAFGSVKWTDWSVTSSMPICAAGTPVCSQLTAISGLTLMWRDSWTVTLGAARQLNERFHIAANVTWDQGASQGFTSQTDTWTGTLTLLYSPNEAAQFRLGVTAGTMTSGTLNTGMLPGGIPNPVGYTASFGNDAIFAIDGGVSIEF